MIRPLIVGNWKMHKTIGEALAFAGQLKQRLPGTEGKTVVLAPSFTALFPLAETLKGSGIMLAAQNLCDKEEGAYTGEVSARMLADAGCRFVIIGHSERRTLFGEGDDLINRKVRTSLKYALTPILCIGETLREREAGHTFTVLARQVQEGLQELTPADAARIVVAYEPVWAIGTGKTAQPAEANEAHAFIRERVGKQYGPELALALPIIYGGSVNPANSEALLAREDINGALVGGASLDCEAFARIVSK